MQREELHRLLGELSREEVEGRRWYQAALARGLSREEYLAELRRFWDGLLVRGVDDWNQPRLSESVGRSSSGLRGGPLLPAKEGVGRWMIIQQHIRYGIYTAHRHEFVELCYMVSGSCENTVNGRTYRMEPGDLFIFDRNTVHQLGFLEENDILVNILLLPEMASSIVTDTLAWNSSVAAFLTEASYGRSTEPNFLYLRGGSEISDKLEELLCAYFGGDAPGVDNYIELCLRQFFILLWQASLEEGKLTYQFQPDPQNANLLEYIEQNCVDCTRESVAEHFHYSSSYLSTILSKNFGRSFVELRTGFRLERAQKLLDGTNLSVRTVASECGYSNLTQFYNQYKKTYGRLPREA